MFKIPRVNVIESDDGFSIEVLGMTGLKYTQNGKSLRINSEILRGHPDIMIDTKSLVKWETGEIIDVQLKKQIVDNLNRAFKFRGIEVDFR
jgi:hypothetical protein